jgi:hypothetical protein
LEEAKEAGIAKAKAGGEKSSKEYTCVKEAAQCIGGWEEEDWS